MIKYLATVGLLFALSGCESTISNDGSVSIKAGGTKSDGDTLTTLALNEENIQTLLTVAPWTKIEANIQAFYENGNYPSDRESYTIFMTFDKRTVTAYADCQKVTAKYRLNGKDITFNDLSIAPAIDLPTCVESEFADDAVAALFENSFKVTKITQKEALFEALDFDTNIVLKR
jgi:heat shock protein HslJ